MRKYGGGHYFKYWELAGNVMVAKGVKRCEKAAEELCSGKRHQPTGLMAHNNQ